MTDSVPASHGVTDDGIGIAVMLEIYRNILQNPVEHTVIFNFNNYEEGGLWGSRGFLHHPWAKNVRGFLNLGKYHFLYALIRIFTLIANN